MKLMMIRVILCLILAKTNIAIFENPFQIRNLFGYVLEIGSKIVELRIDDENVNTLLKKISTFRQEIDASSSVVSGNVRNKEKELIWNHLCSNPIHVFQLISASRLIVEEILPFFKQSPPCKKNFVISIFVRISDINFKIFSCRRGSHD